MLFSTYFCTRRFVCLYSVVLFLILSIFLPLSISPSLTPTHALSVPLVITFSKLCRCLGPFIFHLLLGRYFWLILLTLSVCVCVSFSLAFYLSLFIAFFYRLNCLPTSHSLLRCRCCPTISFISSV